MTIVQSIQFFVALNLFVVGLSHFLQPKIWIEFFEFLHQKGNVGNIFNALLALGMGSFIISFHFIWTWPMILVTIYGLAQLTKGLIYLSIPQVGLNSIGKVDDKSKKFKWVGLIMCILSIMLIIYLVNDQLF